jgi:hypothetical protein
VRQACVAYLYLSLDSETTSVSSVFREQANIESISKLLRFESSKPPPPLPAKDDDDDDEGDKEPVPELTTVSLAQVNERVVENQRNIFFLTTPSKELAASSPYFEAFEAAGVEVLYVFSDMDEFVMQVSGAGCDADFPCVHVSCLSYAALSLSLTLSSLSSALSLPHSALSPSVCVFRISAASMARPS